MSTATITKSIRLSVKESEDLIKLGEQNSVSESALMKKWIQDGIQAKKMEIAIQAYMQRKTDLRGGAEMAEVSYNRFMHEVESRHIVILDNDGRFLDRLSFLAQAFNNSELQDAIKTLRAKDEVLAPVTVQP